MNKLLSIIIPVYNEEKIAAAALAEIFSLNINKEIIVVNDGSTDNTFAILENLKNQSDFKLINQPTNQGKGAAVKRGLEEISGDYFIVYDADLEYDPRDIILLLSEIQKTDRTDLVIYGSRFLINKPTTFHYLINKFLTGLTNFLFSSRLTDMETCFKLVPTSALKKIRLSGQRFEIEPEITAQLLKNGYQINELPIRYARRGYKEGKKIKARDGLLAVKTLLKEKLFVR
ncbi:MAG: glycosyltransferase family 2 protein [Patescibacteria group bacterium]